MIKKKWKIIKIHERIDEKVGITPRIRYASSFT